jgi:hypothetical protein
MLRIGLVRRSLDEIAPTRSLTPLFKEPTPRGTNLKLNNLSADGRFELKKMPVVVLLFAISAPAFAGGRNTDPNWGTVVGAGILGGMLGAASAPAAPQPQIIIIQPPAAAPPPTPQPTPPPTSLSEPHSWWCTGSQRWYPEVQTCAAGIWTHQVSQPPPPPPTYNPAIGSGGALALGSGNPVNDSLLASSPDRQKTALANSVGKVVWESRRSRWA